MKFGREVTRAILTVALLLGGANATAAGSAPSGWTPLPDPNAGFVPAEQHSLPAQRALDRFIADFSVEVARAIAAQQQENDVACKDFAAAHHAAPGSAVWQANCRYRRY
jgi:hypothetical protein